MQSTQEDLADLPGRGCIAAGMGENYLRPLKAAEAVARDIVHDIIEQGLKPGDRLPSEAVMLVQYRVSRESLREGLRLLEVQGLITIRRGPGGGPVVGTVDPANLGRVSTLFFYMAAATYNELFEAWIVAECMLAERAARHPDLEVRREAMAPYLDLDAQRSPEEMEAFVERHSRFHATLGVLAENRVLELTLRSFGQIVTHHITTIDDPRVLGDLIVDDHIDLARAVSAGHHQRARHLMEEHIAAIVEHSKQHLDASPDALIEWL